MRVLLIGRWGKTHAIAKALAKSKNVELYSLMDKKNNGIVDLSKRYELLDITDPEKIKHFAHENDIEMAVVVPEMSLAQDMTRHFHDMGIPSVGPSEFCTRLEGDKAFLRNLMKENGIEAYPEFHVFHDEEKAVDYISGTAAPLAVKPIGITEGDGVKVMGIQLNDKEEAKDYVREVFRDSIGEIPGVIIEEKIEGEEYTLQMFCDGKTIAPMPAVRDYKLLEEGESGMNTPGMGSYSSSDHLLPFLTREDFYKSIEIIQDILNVLAEKYNERFNGILSGQYMLTRSGIKLVEINVRPGDSEILNITPIIKTDFLEICQAIATGALNEIGIEYENKATVCKYAVPEGFPTPEGLVRIEIDKKCVEEAGTHLFQSCFEAGDNLFKPSPRLFAITGVGDTLKEAYDRCETGLSCISGEGIFHRKDIGTAVLTDNYKKFPWLKRERKEII